MKVFMTGDTHGVFEKIEKFCKEKKTQKEDLIIILGDAGINYFCDFRDDDKKKLLESLPITILAVHGNHEARPCTLYGYHERNWHGGKIYVEETYPSLLFAKDGEIYDISILHQMWQRNVRG